jgi:hypothetical protein
MIISTSGTSPYQIIIIFFFLILIPFPFLILITITIAADVIVPCIAASHELLHRLQENWTYTTTRRTVTLLLFMHHSPVHSFVFCEDCAPSRGDAHASGVVGAT